jgi:NitT/TauT family transport system ATP-binding protein
LGSQILLMDEPFGALDAQTRLTMQELLLSVWDRLKPTIIFVTHDIDEALFLADKIYVMSARPGRMESVIDTQLPRPRAIEMTATPEFNEMKLQILKTIRSH